MKPKTHMIRGERWRIQRPQAPGDLGAARYATKRLEIPHDGDAEHELDTILHEVLHAAVPDLCEQTVTETANAQSTLLWRLGWRNEGESA